MAEDEALATFAQDFHQEVLARSTTEGMESFVGDAFTEVFTDYLAAQGEIHDATVCFFQSSPRGNRPPDLRASGYLVDADEGRIDLFGAISSGEVPPARIPRAAVDSEFTRLANFLERALDGLHSKMEPASPAYDMASEIHRVRDGLSHIRLFLLTDGLTTVEHLPESTIRGARVTLQVWDLRRLFRLVTSGHGREEICIDLEQQYGVTIPCLQAPSMGDYRAYLALVPGDLLFRIYDEYGPRLLERNVRSFLQARGKVNQGIRDTIRNAPNRFLAYNNGISAIAESIDLVSRKEGLAISRLTGLQIVNGGQTTASLHLAARRDRIDLSSIMVQAKIVVVDPAQIENIVPRISLYANSQNRISEADFSANDSFHIKLEELSRTVWAPSVDGSQHQTKWFYERARGQYADEQARRQTPARRNAFLREYPPSKKFTKTDVAKYENAYEQLPHLVSRGAQKNFVEFTLRMDEAETVPGIPDFHDLVAKAIIFKATERIVSRQNFGGYRANIVAYTVASLSRLFDERIDLNVIWRTQKVGGEYETTIAEVAHVVHSVIVNAPNGRNVTEWCKTEDCWKQVCTRLQPRTTLSGSTIHDPTVTRPRTRTTPAAPAAISAPAGRLARDLPYSSVLEGLKVGEFRSVDLVPGQSTAALTRELRQAIRKLGRKVGDDFELVPFDKAVYVTRVR